MSEAGGPAAAPSRSAHGGGYGRVEPRRRDPHGVVGAAPFSEPLPQFRFYQRQGGGPAKLRWSRADRVPEDGIGQGARLLRRLLPRERSRRDRAVFSGDG